MFLDMATHQTPGRGLRMTVRVKPEHVVCGGEATLAKREPTSSRREYLLGQMFARESLQRALQRVKRNASSAGVDGITVVELPTSLRTAWPRLRQELRDGTYRPQPVRGHAIPKTDGTSASLVFRRCSTASSSKRCCRCCNH